MHEFHDIKVIEKVNTQENFIIKCDDALQIEELKRIFKCKAKKITYEQFISHRYGQDS